MRLIAHRANLYGPDTRTENTIKKTMECFDNGFDVELDVWKFNNNLFLGHDSPNYLNNPVDIDFLYAHRDRLWLHAKNADAFHSLHSDVSGKDFNYFWHQKDDFTITSKGYHWVYPGKSIDKNSVWVLPENIIERSRPFKKTDFLPLKKVIGSNWEYQSDIFDFYTICTDWPIAIKKVLE